jgi:hypothetical protein
MPAHPKSESYLSIAHIFGALGDVAAVLTVVLLERALMHKRSMNFVVCGEARENLRIFVLERHRKGL